MKSWHYFISSTVRKLSEIILGPVESGDCSVKLTLTFSNGLFSIVMKTLSPDIMSTIDHGAMDKNIFNFYAGNYGSSACKLFQTFQLKTKHFIMINISLTFEKQFLNIIMISLEHYHHPPSTLDVHYLQWLNDNHNCQFCHLPSSTWSNKSVNQIFCTEALHYAKSCI